LSIFFQSFCFVLSIIIVAAVAAAAAAVDKCVGEMVSLCLRQVCDAWTDKMSKGPSFCNICMDAETMHVALTAVERGLAIAFTHAHGTVQASDPDGRHWDSQHEIRRWSLLFG
jgi:hypothetical protein